jgi:hypothetical protein
MAPVFTALFTAHLLGSFALPAKWTGRASRIWPQLFNSALIAFLSCLLLGAIRWEILFAVFAARLILNSIEARNVSSSAAPFLILQFLHLAVLFWLAFAFPDAAANGWWIADLTTDWSRRYFAALSCISGIVLCVPFGGILISRLISRFNEEIRICDIAGLTQGGQYIGWLERILVMLLLLINQPNGIGFLIAAKSILRFGEIKDASQRRVAEYIIIGTFLSFGWALVVSVVTQKTLRYWAP